MGMVTFGAPRRLIRSLAEAVGADTFVETGTFLGKTARWASGAFERVITVEGSEKLYAEAVEEHADLENVRFLHGASEDVLGDVVAELEEPAIFWLDAHWCGGTTYGAEHECPVLDEIRIVNGSPLEHVVLIDDARFFTSPPPPPNDPEQWPSFQAVVDALGQASFDRYTVIQDDVIVSVPQEKSNAVWTAVWKARRSLLGRAGESPARG